MAKQQEQEWVEAQKIVISTDLVEATKKHLKFLEVVENNGHLYDGPALEKAIFRYKYCWLPLLAKHTASDKPERQLVVPLDCEWIWHCHRLNPVRYMVDCKKLFGRILDPGCVVISSIESVCKKQTEDIWHKQYPEEPYELNFGDHVMNDIGSKLATTPSTTYDLVSAVMRQSSFYEKVSGTRFKDNLYLEEAVKRYKGFLHLVKKNVEMKSKNACVPTYDIDLMWHSHQLHPLSYCNDVFALVGQVLHHDDTDTDQNKGGKLDVGTKTTTEQWGEMFGSVYYRVGSRQITKGMEGHKLVAKCSCAAEDMEGKKLITLTSKCSCATQVMEGDNSFDKTAKCMTARCKCINEVTEGEKSFEMTAKCMTARCKCISEVTQGEKSFEMTAKCMTARCKCISDVIEGELFEMTAKCMTARCKCISEEFTEGKRLLEMTAKCMTATCKCISEVAEGEKSLDITAKCMTATCKCISEVSKGENTFEMTAKCMTTSIIQV